MFFGTDNGISILNVATGSWQHICPGVVVIDLFTTSDNRILASTFGKGVYEISANGAARVLYSIEQGTLRDDHVYATFIDKDNNLWMGCLEGDLVLKSSSGFQYFAVKNVLCITQLPSGDIAVGTADGIKLVNSGSATVSELNYSSGNDVNRYVASMLVNNGELWIGTDGGGIYIYDLAKKTSIQLTTEQGLPSNCVSSLISGPDGRIWVGTDQGLAFVSAADRKVVNVNYCYGIDREYSYGAALLLKDGKLLFGTTTGAVMVTPSGFNGLDYTTKLRITGVSCENCDDEKQFKERVHKMLANNKLELSYDQSTFDLYYESINLRNQYDIAYQYRVGDGEWSQLTDQQYIRFTNLAPGTHHLLLRCVSLTSHAVIDEVELTIVISQPWWNTWWMWCVYALLLLLALYGAWRTYKLHDKYMRLTIDYLRLIQETPDDKSSQIERAVAAAAGVDVIVACVGENSYAETPGNLDDLALSQNQRDLVKALARTGKPIVLILNEGRPRLVNDIEPLAQAVVNILLPGNEGGNALARLLAGDDNFSARMPYTYPRYPSSLTTYDYRVSEESGTMEGVYDYNAQVDVQWPFGYGMSYTTFTYSNLQVDKTNFGPNDVLNISVDVRNDGPRAGKEAVLMFSRDMVASIVPESRRLRAFTKIDLLPGETKTVKFKLPASDLAFVGNDNQRHLEPGEFVIQIANQALRINCK